MRLPVPKTWVHHTVTNATSNGDRDVRQVEAIGVSRFGIMSYSYLYHPPSRQWYVGAGTTVGAHTGGQNSTSLGLSVIGNTNNDPVPHFAQDLAELLEWLQVRGIVAQGEQPTGGHRDTKATACPGNNAYNQIPEARRILASGGGSTPPDDGDDFLSALSDNQQREVYVWLKNLNNRLGIPGESVSQVIAETARRTEDLVSGHRPQQVVNQIDEIHTEVTKKSESKSRKSKSKKTDPQPD